MATTAALVFAGKSVATPAISFIMNKAFSYLSKWHQAEGMEAIKDRLQRRLTEIQAVYAAVDQEQVDVLRGSALDDWLWQFRDALEGAEDVLDEIDYHKLEEEAEARNLQGQVRNPVANFIKGKVIDKVTKHNSEGNMVKKLRKAMEDLDGVTEGVCTFLHLVNHSNSHALRDHAESNDQETSSALVPTQIFGRDKEKEQIMSWLTDNLDEDQNIDGIRRVPVFSIIGIGGIGKTTLAQVVCRELEGSSHFHKIVWAHVSGDTFSAAKITKKILACSFRCEAALLQNSRCKAAKRTCCLEAVLNARPNADTLQALQNILRDILEPKKYLLILDDVWEDRKRGEWEKLMAPLWDIQRGSRILLTTRMRSAADLVTSVMRSKKHYLHLNGLAKDDNFMLFQNVAFEGMKAEDYGRLLPKAEKIVDKFQGCPLVTQIAGAHLKENIGDQHWENLFKQLEQLEGSLDVIVTTVLRSSYRHLPEDFQLCFRYCSIFPKGYMFKKEELVKMWMGSGLIPQSKSEVERPEDIGERYLMKLARKSFFSIVATGDPYSKHYTEYYVIHDLLHDLARNVSADECLRLESGGHMHGRPTIRHLWITNLSKLTFREIKAILLFKKLRTLVIENHGDIGIVHVTTLETVVENLKGLRLLSLKRVPMFCLTKEVANKHLRYVSFSGMQKVHGVSKLYHLQLLTADKRIDIAPEQLKELGNLSCLRHASYGVHGFGEFLVSGLISLQELHNFRIQAKEGYQISSLRNLSSLSKLEICNLENVRSHEEVIDAKLNEKAHLQSLSLQWSETNETPKNEDNLVIEKLEPPMCLEKLEIAGFTGARFPSWINHLSLGNMVSLELKSCRNWVYLPGLENLHFLKHLELQNLTELRMINQSSDAYLPRNLKTLVVEACKNLRELPFLPPSLAQLEITKVGLSILPRIHDHHGNNMSSEGTTPPKLVSVIISDCSNLTSLEGSFLQQEHHVQTLRILKIVDCKKIIRAPLLFGEMNDLTEFRIGSCYSLRMLETFDGALLPSTLKELSIVECGDFQLPLLESLLGLTNLTSLNIHKCSRVKNLPSSGVFKGLKALQEFYVTECIFLSSLGGIGALSDLTWLEIRV
ncbi:hypothetical protein EJB05_26626, partial [Eragrostis curvula]